MKDIRLRPPFDSAVLEEAVASSMRSWGHDLSHTADWLLKLNDEDLMSAAIRKAWRQSDLPLRAWAKLIIRVSAYTTDEHDSIWLEVILTGWGQHDVMQQAPFTLAMLQTCGWMLRSPVPRVMCDVALSAPGLKLKDAALIGVPQAYIEPMGSIRRWIQAESVTLGETREELPLDFFIAEVAMDQDGDQIVLGSDNRLYFFGHEVGAMFRCKVNLEELIAEFFRNPTSLLDDDFLGVKW